LLHRAILRELTLTFSIGVFVLLSLILIGRGLQLRDIFLGLEFSFADIALLFLYMAPMFMIMILPISCMLSVFLTFLRMSTDRELVALKAGGVSIYQMLRSPVLFSFICMCFAIFISLHAIAWGMNNFRTTILEIANTKARLVIQPGIFNRDIFGLTLFARKVDPITGTLSQVIFEDSTQDEKSSVTVLAPEGDITTDHEQGVLLFHLRNGRLYRVINDKVSILEFEEYKIGLDFGVLLSAIDLGSVRPKEMSWRELRRMDRQKTAPNPRYQRWVGVEMHKRWSLPVACLVLGLFSLPLACAFEGVKRQLGIVLALVMFLLYYSIHSIGMNMGESGVLPPTIGLWIANIFFALAAGLGLHLVYKERVPSVTQFIQHFKDRFRYRRRKDKEAI
jgi:lipopolysaccharide export system permease protein